MCFTYFRWYIAVRRGVEKFPEIHYLREFQENFSQALNFKKFFVYYFTRLRLCRCELCAEYALIMKYLGLMWCVDGMLFERYSIYAQCLIIIIINMRDCILQYDFNVFINWIINLFFNFRNFIMLWHNII